MISSHSLNRLESITSLKSFGSSAEMQAKSKDTSMATSGLANFSKSTANDGGSSSKVTMDQIRQLEAKIECLNSQIANLTKKPLAEQK